MSDHPKITIKAIFLLLFPLLLFLLLLLLLLLQDCSHHLTNQVPTAVVRSLVLFPKSPHQLKRTFLHSLHSLMTEKGGQLWMRQQPNPPNLLLPPGVGDQRYPGLLQSLPLLLPLAGWRLLKKKVVLLPSRRGDPGQNQVNLKVQVYTYVLIFLVALYNCDAIYSYSLCWIGLDVEHPLDEDAPLINY